jgi:hypothetical protein
MRRAFISLLAVLPLACVPAAAAADTGPCVVVTGTVVSVDGAHNQFVGNASVVPQSPGNFCPAVPTGPILTAPERFHAPAAVTSTTQVTIATDPTTKIRVNGRVGTVSDLRPNDHFNAMFSGTPDEPIETIVSGHTLTLEATTPVRRHELFAFVGTVTAVDVKGKTVTVSVTQSFPSDLVPSGSDPVSFTVDRHTFVLGGNARYGLAGGSLAGVQVGDVVAGATVGWSDMLLPAVQKLPLQLLLDIPVATNTGGAGIYTGIQTQALRHALHLFGVKPAASHHKAKHHKRAHSKKTSHSSHAKRA